MASESPNFDRAIFKTPNPNELQSEEAHEAVRDRIDDQPEADLTDVDRTAQEKDASADESISSVDRQAGIIGRAAG